MPGSKKYGKKDKRPAVKHSGTFLDNIGAGDAPQKFIVLKTSGGPRSDDGAPQTIQSAASTDEDCRTGDTCKLVNLHIECGPRNNIAEVEDRTGWLEWAFVLVRENETEVPITRLGVQTLGDVCTNMYRGECIYTGAIPIGNAQPAVAEITLKIPKSKKKIKLGDEWRFITSFRAVSSTSTANASIRIIKSYNYLVRS